MKEVRFGAAVINYHGDILAYTVQSTCSQVEEKMRDTNPFWKKLKETGDHIENILLVRNGSRKEVLKRINQYYDLVEEGKSTL